MMFKAMIPFHETEPRPQNCAQIACTKQMAGCSSGFESSLGINRAVTKYFNAKLFSQTNKQPSEPPKSNVIQKNG